MIESSRRLERERILSLLYEAEMKGETIDELLSSLPVAPEPFVTTTIKGVSAKRDELDSLIESCASNWSADRMASIDLNILRIGAWELSERSDLSIAVIISEAVELAKRFSNEDSSKFVNGVLASVATIVRP